MIRRWFRWLAPLILAACAGLADAPAQSIEVPRGHKALQQETDEGARTAALPYAVAALSFLVVMVILCTPTRKS